MKMNILVSLNENYLPQLRVMLASLMLNEPGVELNVYLLHSGIPAERLENVRRALDSHGHEFHPVLVDSSLFAKAFEDTTVKRYYSQEMFYRLLAGQLLPESVDRILYLDPDILVINSLVPLWQTDLRGCLFAAAAHSGRSELMDGVNKRRLGTDQSYYNSGVLLMDLARCREEIVPDDIFGYVDKHAATLFLPDQDVLNALYGSRILPVEDVRWNYDARNYHDYYLVSMRAHNVEWVIANTAILHFCGKAKPWKPHYHHRFGVLYRHYMHLADIIVPGEF